MQLNFKHVIVSFHKIWIIVTNTTDQFKWDSTYGMEYARLLQVTVYTKFT